MDNYYLAANGIGSYSTRGGVYKADSRGLIHLTLDHISDVADLIGAGCVLLATNTPLYSRLYSPLPHMTLTVLPSGNVYTSDSDSLMLVPLSLPADASGLVTLGCEMHGTC
jgi:hypothetical protein